MKIIYSTDVIIDYYKKINKWYYYKYRVEKLI